MSQAVNVETSSAKPKRQYRKGNPLSVNERKMASLEKKKETHKEVRAFVRNPLKDKLALMCEEDGLSQAEMIEFLIEQEAIRRDKM